MLRALVVAALLAAVALAPAAAALPAPAPIPCHDHVTCALAHAVHHALEAAGPVLCHHVPCPT